ncbi:MAG: DUF1616 domain-containing protein [Euryarchaeota archaeon]|uniref:DUF1616 domain-containing protein n=1 Tax=Methanobacterium sp. MZD130B TaxID=3394378 RepID=UPI0039FD3D75|nr:DUF1616 domain-containing protein [Euryarchaeota archaeon]
MNLDRTITTFILILIIIGVIGVFYLVLNPIPSEKFTEFYILDGNGRAVDYPANLSIGEKSNLTVVVVNREHSEFSYQVKIIQGKQLLKEEKFTLNTGDRKEIPLEFVADHLGQNKLEFKLYKLPDTENIYRYLYLQVNVS